MRSKGNFCNLMLILLSVFFFILDKFDQEGLHKVPIILLIPSVVNIHVSSLYFNMM